MKERPILFSAPMIRAQRAGIKTQTRRPVKGFALEWLTVHSGFNSEFVALPENRLCPYGNSGDRLRVKEAAWMWCERIPNGRTKTGRDKWLYVSLRGAPIHYAADHPAKPAIDVVSPSTGNKWGWRLKIGRFLPAWASRTTLEITGVRIERLLDISEQDAIAEGIELFTDFQPTGHWKRYRDGGLNSYVDNPIASYASLWTEINGNGSWEMNPWVWVVEFKDVQKGGAA